MVNICWAFQTKAILDIISHAGALNITYKCVASDEMQNPIASCLSTRYETTNTPCCVCMWLFHLKECWQSSRGYFLICRHQATQNAMQFQWDPSYQCAASSADIGVYFWCPGQWFGPLDLQLPHEALEEQHGVTLQPGTG